MTSDCAAHAQNEKSDFILPKAVVGDGSAGKLEFLHVSPSRPFLKQTY